MSIHSKDRKNLVSLSVIQLTVMVYENILGWYRVAKYHGETYTLGTVNVSFRLHHGDAASRMTSLLCPMRYTNE